MSATERMVLAQLNDHVPLRLIEIHDQLGGVLSFGAIVVALQSLCDKGLARRDPTNVISPDSKQRSIGLYTRALPDTPKTPEEPK